MPLIRYFMFVGGSLLGLLFLADWYVPITRTEASTRDIDRTIIRIHSNHQWPAAVRIDTSLTTLKTAPPTVVGDNGAINTSNGQARDAYAYVSPPVLEASGRIQRRVRPISRWSKTRRRLASSQAN